MMLKKIVFFIVLATLFGCKGDNDDDIRSDDVENIDLTEGIVFGTINPDATGQNVAYRYTDEGIFLVSGVNSGSNSDSWSTSNCPFQESSLIAEFAKGIPNVARGIRDVNSTDISETNGNGDQFYILEYTITGSEELKTIQFTENQRFNEEQVDTYFSYIRDTLDLISLSSEVPQTTCPIL